MYIKGLILCFVFFLQIAEAKSLCAKKCQPGMDCCIKIFDSLKLLGQINITARCGKKFCQKGETCRNRSCLRISTPRPTNVPKPTRVGQINRAIVKYGSNYCHENIYYMCQHFDNKQKLPTQEGFAVIISTANDQRITIRQQREGNKLDSYANYWNYHVIFISKYQRRARVYDFDSKLPFGVRFTVAWKDALNPKPSEQNKTLFRVIQYRQYLAIFSCQRQVYDEKNKDPDYTPPTKYPIRVNKFGEENACHRFLDMNDRNASLGKILTAAQFYSMFQEK